MDQCLITNSKVTVIISCTDNTISVSVPYFIKMLQGSEGKGDELQLTDSQMARNRLLLWRILKKGIFWSQSLGYMLKAAEHGLKAAQKDQTGGGNNELSYLLKVRSTAKK